MLTSRCSRSCLNRGIYHTKTGQLKEPTDHHELTMQSISADVEDKTSRGHSTNFLGCKLIFDDISAFRCVDFLHFFQFNNVTPICCQNKHSRGSLIYNLYGE